MQRYHVPITELGALQRHVWEFRDVGTILQVGTGQTRRSIPWRGLEIQYVIRSAPERVVLMEFNDASPPPPPPPSHRAPRTSIARKSSRSGGLISLARALVNLLSRWIGFNRNAYSFTSFVRSYSAMSAITSRWVLNSASGATWAGSLFVAFRNSDRIKENWSRLGTFSQGDPQHANKGVEDSREKPTQSEVRLPWKPNWSVLFTFLFSPDSVLPNEHRKGVTSLLDEIEAGLVLVVDNKAIRNRECPNNQYFRKSGKLMKTRFPRNGNERGDVPFLHSLYKLRLRKMGSIALPLSKFAEGRDLAFGDSSRNLGQQGHKISRQLRCLVQTVSGFIRKYLYDFEPPIGIQRS